MTYRRQLSDFGPTRAVRVCRPDVYVPSHEEVGDLKAKLLLDFFLGEVGPTVYNGAIADAQAYFQGKVADLEGSCYEAEFSYWR